MKKTIDIPNKTERKALNEIMLRLEKFDHSRNAEVKKAFETYGNEMSDSEYIKRYTQRIEEIASGEEKTRACIVCQKKGAKNRVVCNDCMKQLKKFSLNPVDHFVDKIDDMVGGDGYVKMGWKDLFDELFKKHSMEAAEEIFVCGTKGTRPSEEQMLSSWPKPWLYGKAFLFFLVAFLVAFVTFLLGVPIMAPTILILGAMVVPVPLLIMFFELNVPRNISILSVMEYFLIGGLISIYITVLLGMFGPDGDLTVFKAIVVGVREELAKLIVVVAILKKRKKTTKNYLLNGLLIGAAVGAGFAVFESAGYANDSMLTVAEIDEEVSIAFDALSAFAITVLRGILSPGAHIAWAAIGGFAAVMVGEKKNYKLSFIFNKRFLSIFMIPVLFHAIWDMPFDILLPPTKEMLLVVTIWIVLMVFIDNGLDEINIINREKNIS